MVVSSAPTLVSSSEDGTCRVWDIASGQSVRVQQLKGAVMSVHSTVQSYQLPTTWHFIYLIITGAVVHSLMSWGDVLPRVGKHREGARGRDTSISIAPFQKQLSYCRDGVGLEDVQISLRRTVDPVRE